jgi:Tfp pilus assembly protein PilN
MRPLNLIPPEQRRGEQAPLRSGPLAYIVVGTLVAVLAGVTALVLTGNQISEREGEVARLEVEDARESARAARLAAYVQFRDLSEQRVATVASLANSRFDWERVMRELALILPRDAWLVSLTASAAPGIGIEGGGGGAAGLRGSAPGPALELSGCATGQEAVASFVTALKDIDGVTRVGVQSSELPEKNSDGESGGGDGSDSGSDECRTREFIAKFEIVVAFDAAPVPISTTGEAAPVATTAAPETTETSGESSEGE